MPAVTQRLVPQPGERGLASTDPAQVAPLLDGAWAGLLEVAAEVDLDAPSRLERWSARDVLVHLGAWDGHRDMSNEVDEARSARVVSQDDRDARNAGLVAEHHDASREEVLEALSAARSRTADLLAHPEADVLGRRWVGSVVGDLPLTGLLVAQAYELAVHALDLAPAGAREPPSGLLDAGVAAVVDVTGALAARRGLSTSFCVVTPAGSWAVGAADDAWTTLRLGVDVLARDLPWPALEGSAADVLDATAGRTLAAQLVLTRRLRLHDVPGLLRLLPALEAAPGLPGGSAAQATLRTIAQTGRLAGRLGGGLGSLLTRGQR